MGFVSSHEVHLYISIDTATTWNKSHFILLDRPDFHMITWHILTSLSIDERLLLKYINLSTNFRGLPLRVELTPSHLKYMYLHFVWNAVYAGRIADVYVNLATIPGWIKKTDGEPDEWKKWNVITKMCGMNKKWQAKWPTLKFKTSVNISCVWSARSIKNKSMSVLEDAICR